MRRCIRFAITLGREYSGPVKTVTMTMRGCPEGVREALRKSAKANRRSLNKEAMTWLEREAARDTEERPMTGRELARVLREFNKGLTLKDRRELAEAIEEAGRRMGRGELH